MNNNLSDTAKYIVMIGPEYKSRGGIASVIATYFDHGLMDNWPVIFLPTHVEAGKWRKLLRAMLSLMEFIKLLYQRKAGVLHVHVARRNSFWRKSIFMQLAFFFDCPVLIHLHSGGFPAFYDHECGVFQKWLVRYFLSNASALIVLTESWQDAYTRFTPKKILVLPNFVELLPMKQEYSASPSSLLFLGRLSQEKGVFDLFAAVAMLVDKYPDLIVKLGGEGNIDEVNASINTLKITGHVRLEGWVEGDKKTELLNENSIFVLPSYVEGLPMGALEAMVAGLPVVVTRVGGVPDMIDDGLTGLIVEPGDVPGLAKQLDRLLSDANLRSRLVLAARKSVEERYSANAVIPILEGLYTSFGIIRP